MTRDAYADLHAGFRWQVPQDFNIAEVCCARWARDTPDAVAIHYEHEDGCGGRFTFADLQNNANRFANALVKLGVQRGDRVAGRRTRAAAGDAGVGLPFSRVARS